MAANSESRRSKQPRTSWITRQRAKRGVSLVRGHPRCATCQIPMVMRQGKHGLFWGCSQYPKCRYTRMFTGQTATPKTKLAWKTKLYEVNGEVVAIENAEAVPLDYVDED